MPPPDMKFDRAPRLPVAYVEWRGPYDGIGEPMAKLKGWLEREGIEQAGPPLCLFYDNPGETPAGGLRSEACIPVARVFEGEGGFRFKELGETDVAETRHGGPPEEFGKTYGPFLEGLLGLGYRLDGPAREFFRTVEDVKGPGSGYLIQQPISERPRV